MTSKAKKLAALREITALKSEISRAKLSGHKAEIEAIEDRIRKLDHSHGLEAGETLAQARAIAQYSHWAAGRRSALRADLAMAMARAQPVKEMAARDEARAQVVKRLMKSQPRRSDE